MVYSDVRSYVVLLYSCGCLACGWRSAGVGGVGRELSAGSADGVGWDGACRSVLLPGAFCCVCWFCSVRWVVLDVVVVVVVGCQRVADDVSVTEVGTVPSE